MAFTEVLLIKPVDGLGAEGEQVRVRSGYARNFLLLQGIALPVNRANTKYIESLKKAREVREAKDLESANAISAKLAALKLVFAVKTGEGGKMFGAISTAEIAAKLAEHGIELERKRIHLGQGPVKVLGKHLTTIRLHAAVSVEQEFEVVSENPIEPVAEEAEEAPDRSERDSKPRKPRKDKKEAK
ncbi:MAG: 50S ribosomal protein L9 [Verrucomicrobia bacterium]|jgi:large subunit ribosomal protein L9|nr:50S ribosomal protein L9 [Verrucomicrobiota bacterium]